MSKELIERLRNTTYHNLDPYEAADHIEQLQRRIEYLELCCDEGERQLAASQAREQQLREALERIADLRNLGEIYPEVVAFEALAIQSDTTALEALIRKAGDVMRERCACIRYDEKLEKAIRALPGVTLGDLK